MRIGFITGEYPPMRGGIATFTRILGTELAKTGHQIYVLTSEDGQYQGDQIQVDTVKNWGWRISKMVNRWANDNQLDIVNLHYQTAAFSMSPWIHFLPDLVQVPLVTTLHDLRFPYLFPKAGPIRDWIVRHLAERSDGRIFTNDEDQQTIGDLPRTQLIRIGSNIRTDIPTAESNTYVIDDRLSDAFVVGYFGFINHSKGLDDLIRALPLIDVDCPTKLLIIGERHGHSDPTNVHYAQQIDDLIAEYELEDQIIYTGYLPENDVAAYLQRCDLVTLPYRDGASFRRGTLLAAIEQECVIITTEPTVPISSINENRFALVPPYRPDKIAEAITKLANNPRERERLQDSVRQLKAEFAWETLVQQTEVFFQDVIRWHLAQS